MQRLIHTQPGEAPRARLRLRAREEAEELEAAQRKATDAQDTREIQLLEREAQLHEMKEYERFEVASKCDDEEAW